MQKGFNRREFIKEMGKTGFALSGIFALEKLLTGCTSVRSSLMLNEQSPVVYPSLRGHKVQPPENGCYIGFHGGTIAIYKRIIGVVPKVMVPPNTLMEWRRSFLKEQVEEISSQGAIPYVWREFVFEIPYYGFGNIVGQPAVTREITQFAQGIVEFGKPIFVSSMREMNGLWYPWGGNPKHFKNVWKYAWQIFEDNGANEYATWVWTPYCPLPGSRIDEPERYYPGDQYVDWIGFSTYAREQFPVSDVSLRSLITGSYSDMRRNHKSKPILIAESGKTRNQDQPRWLKDAFKTIQEMKGLKVFIYYDNASIPIYSGQNIQDENHTISDESFEVYQAALKAHYFIGVR